MNWWWRMLKEAKSPKAIEHKRKYETEYESTPERKKYRRELERERRRRGVAGKGGKDMSHTKRGTIVPEDPHTNRARSHPSVGSTLKMVVIKEQPPLSISSCAMCGTRTKLTDMRPDADGHLCTNCYIRMLMQGGREVAQERQAQREHDQRFDTMMYHSEPMDIVARLLKGFPAQYPGNCKVCGRFIQQGEEVNYNRNLGGIVCPRNCGRDYIV